LRGLRELAEKEKFRSIALPRLATGAGRLQWGDVEPFIHENFAGTRFPVIIYTVYKKNLQANEGL
jgi:O-acetyl-ADP-ribose deacetylase (regulator of RNase III)